MRVPQLLLVLVAVMMLLAASQVQGELGRQQVVLVSVQRQAGPAHVHYPASCLALVW